MLYFYVVSLMCCSRENVKFYYTYKCLYKKKNSWINLFLLVLSPCLKIRDKKLFNKIPWDFPRDPVVKNLPANGADMGSIPGRGSFYMLWSN